MGPHLFRPFVARFLRNVPVGILAAGAMFALPPVLFAQHPEVDALAVRVAQDLVHHHASVVSVSYFRGEKHGVTEAGRILSLEFSAALTRAAPKIQIIALDPLKALADERGLLPSDVFDPDVARQLSAALGATAQIRGTLETNDQIVRLDLEWVDAKGAVNGKVPKDRPKRIGKASATLPQSPELTQLFTIPNSEDHSGFLIPGMTGVTYPKCIFCPTPNFTVEAREKRIQGSVYILMTITPKGTVADPILIYGPDPSLNQAALEAVRTWRFTPPRDLMGTPGAMRLDVEVVFRLL